MRPLRIGFRMPVLIALALVGCRGGQPDAPSQGAEPDGRSGVLAAPAVLPAHSHNDYRQANPLSDALSLGFSSVEADIFLMDGELLVAHDREECRPDRTLRDMYLVPLAARARSQGGRIHPGSSAPFTLLIDIKADGPAVYAELERQLGEMSDVLTRIEAGRDSGSLVAGAVTVVISGACPRELIAAAPARLVFVDGRARDLEAPLEQSAPNTLVPLVSMPWRDHFTWLGIGDIPGAQRATLDRLVSRAHARGYRIRFWGAPNLETIWRAQHDAGVDLIGVDDLRRASRLLRAEHGAGTDAPGDAATGS